MALYRFGPEGLTPVRPTTLAGEQIRERQDLQRTLRTQIGVLGDDLLVVAEEYGNFEESRRRIDLLALDRNGSLVVIELKRTDDGGHMELQALRYAAMVSTMTVEQLASTYAEAAHLSVDEAWSALNDWVGASLEELPNQVRIILVSAGFSTEITSTALWLNENYGLDITCVRLVAYRLESQVLLDVQQIIPLPEASDFQIQQRQKNVATAVVRTSGGRDFTRYTVGFNDQELGPLSKQSAVKLAIVGLYRRGAGLRTLQMATNARRWIALHPFPGESLEEAFAREHPARRPVHIWWDLEIEEDGVAWACPRFGGEDTEPMLAQLQQAAPTSAGFHWAAVDRTSLS